MVLRTLLTTATAGLLTLSSVAAPQEHGSGLYASSLADRTALVSLPTATPTAIGNGAVIVVRYLGYRCQHCVRQLTYLHDHADVLRKHGVTVVAVSDDPASVNARLMADAGFDSTLVHLVSDADQATARLVGAVDDTGRDLHAVVVVRDGRVTMSVLSDQPYMDVERIVNAAVAPVVAGTASRLDDYRTRPLSSVVVAGPDDGIRQPLDLDFNRGVVHGNDLWVVMAEQGGHSMAIVHNAGTANQVVRRKKDSRASHFMWRTMAISFGTNGAFGTAQRGEPGDGDFNYMFMGPTLWSADTAIFASRYQDADDYLASHLDMLHQSPWCTGIAHDTGNVYWVSDARYRDVCRYDFADPHEVGGTDHRDGVIRRYSDVSITPPARNEPAHVALDKSTAMLYIVDPGGKRILRLDTRTGTVKEPGVMPDASAEIVEEFSVMQGATVDAVITTGLTEPVGIDVADGYLLVGDRADGTIHMYDLSSGSPVLTTSLATGAADLLGIVVGPDHRIWYVDRATATVNRLVTDRNGSLRADQTVAAVARDVEWTTTFRYQHVGSPTTLALDARTDDGSSGWTVRSEATVSVSEGWNDIPVVVRHGGDVRPTTLVLGATSIENEAPRTYVASVTLIPKDLRRVVVDDATTEAFSIAEAVALTSREGYVTLPADVFNRVADSLTSLETCLWFVGSHGDVSVTDEAVLAQFRQRDVDCFLIGDDPLAIRGVEGSSPSTFFGRYGVLYSGLDSRPNDNGRRVFDGVAQDPVSNGLSLIDCQLPRLDHHRGNRYVPNIRLRPAVTGATTMLVNVDTKAEAAVRYDAGAYRSIILGFSPSRILEEHKRTTLLDKGLEWLEGAAPEPDPTSVSDDVRRGDSPLRFDVGENPFTSSTRVVLHSTTGTDVAVTIHNVSGQRMATLHEGTVDGPLSLTIDGNSLAAGTYFVIVRSADSIAHATLVKR